MEEIEEENEVICTSTMFDLNVERGTTTSLEVNEGEENSSEISDENVSNQRNIIDEEEIVKSRESLFKMFIFEPNKYTNNTKKCVEFWKYIKGREVKPVVCTLDLRDKILVNKSIQTDKIKPSIPSKCPWYMALLELQKYNVHKLLGTSCNKVKCKMCSGDAFFDKYPVSVEDDDIEYLKTLDEWDPFRKYFEDKYTDNPKEYFYKDFCTDAPTTYSLYNIPEGAKTIAPKYITKPLKVPGKKIDKETNTIDLQKKKKGELGEWSVEEEEDEEKQGREEERKKVCFVEHPPDKKIPSLKKMKSDDLKVVKGGKEKKSKVTVRRKKYVDEAIQCEEVEEEEKEEIYCAVCGFSDCTCKENL